MSLPRFPGKQAFPPLVSAEKWAGYRRELHRDELVLPRTALICYQRQVMDWVRSTYRIIDTPVRALEIIRTDDGGVAFAAGFGFGAPATVIALEHVAALGVDTVLSIGFAGGLSEAAEVGDVVLLTHAIRDEGTSYHYAPADVPARPDDALTVALGRTLVEAGLPHRPGGAWTTDAPYRETEAEVQRYRAEGVSVVEMEASALFVVGAALGVRIASAVVVSDLLGGGDWDPRFHDIDLGERLRQMVAAGIGLLAPIPPT